MTITSVLSVVAVLAVLVVLIFGLINMTRGDNQNLSQKLMRLRVILQFVAIVLVMITLYLTTK